ncbi:cob(I)yrinic acid a,c-diamide adenosyltransferase [Synechococcus sp. CS-1328]|uniref:cob(I)yrinic acid a,c-diamide adenosyltransferase n=1 Tax=Synechococcus sp. CS-1328 TaxID=2847976 RepID=UPI00223A8176|nr:cob(I)yrinic acid a,c-diamide adenosyltransferase [Synechococcus sp. CS-1328]MCT0224548.1 cob(I)yrinic acid a,c-diamide adenosyltransferase [Synechococcus sp. CS-1328]
MTASLVSPQGSHRPSQRSESSGRGQRLETRPDLRSDLRPDPRFEPVCPAARAVVPLRPVPLAEGLLQVHTAPFRGSFGAVFSQALRTAGLGSRVLVSQFLKGGVDQGLGRSLWLCGRLQWLRPAVPSCLSAPLQAEAEPELALAAVREVWDFSRQQLLTGAVDLMVLDELGLAIELGYLSLLDVTEVLEQRPAQLDVILTGPAMPAALMAMADQVTQLRRG